MASSATSEFGVEIGARPDLAIEVRRGIADRQIDDAGFGVERERRPQAAAAMLERLRVLPRLGAGLAGIGNEIELPHRLAGLELEGTDPVLGAEIGARRPDDDEIAEDQRRHREILTARGARDRLAPQKRAVGHVERDQIAVGRAAHELAVLDGGAAIGGRDLLALRLPDIGPALAAGLGVDGDGGAPEGEIHHPAIDERARLHRGRLLGAVEADRPQVLGVGRRDLLEIDETRAGIIVRGVKPGVGRGRGPVELVLGGTGDLGDRRPARLRPLRSCL